MRHGPGVRKGNVGVAVEVLLERNPARIYAAAGAEGTAEDG
jgi:hypothetical protein